ncbi:MAG TPA: glutaredoxin domain-containing protein [Vitreimonas sp.]|nr:glutaredoxin domain-containing protein [Vitreimonas sp.]
MTDTHSPLFTIYTTTWCGDCWRIKLWLQANNYLEGKAFQEINIEDDEVAAEKVIEINNGYRSVPTLVFNDGSTLTEPSVMELEKKLATLAKST